LRLEIRRLCHSSLRSGVISQLRVSACSQYSRRTPPGCGWICGTSSAAANFGRCTRAATASARPSAFGESTATSSPPIVHSSAAPPASPKKERRVVGLGSLIAARKSSTSTPVLVRI
jgi:hypothetical protein